jgi:linoleoyl-CoA desaturase
MVHGKYYDLSTFEKTHPGGELVLSQSRGRDVTASVHSHHFSDAVWKTLEKYEVSKKLVVGEIEDMGYSFDPGGFFNVTKRRVIKKLGFGRENGGTRAGPSNLYKLWCAATIVTWLTTWYIACFYPLSVSWWCLPICAVTRSVCTGIGHETVHGRLKGLWHLFGWTVFIPSDQWHDDHCLKHHPHCKRFGHDPDEDLPLVRLSERMPWCRGYMPQVLTQLLISFFLCPGNWADHHLWKSLREMVRAQSLRPLGGLIRETVIWILTQWLVFFTHPEGASAAFLVYFTVVCLSGSLTLHSFHLSHIQEQNSERFYAQSEESLRKVDWGEHQCRTSSNFKVREWFGHSGMLELHIEHHLFPTLPYATQCAIKPIVQETAREFGIPYYEFESLWHGIWAHIVYMADIGWSDRGSEKGVVKKAGGAGE